MNVWPRTLLARILALAGTLAMITGVLLFTQGHLAVRRTEREARAMAHEASESARAFTRTLRPGEATHHLRLLGERRRLFAALAAGQRRRAIGLRVAVAGLLAAFAAYVLSRVQREVDDLGDS